MSSKREGNGPLSKEVFGENGDRVIHGTIEAYRLIDDEELIGKCLATEQDEVFIHPTLFASIECDVNDIYWVQVSLVNDKIRMQERDKFADAPDPSAKIFEVDPVGNNQ